MAYKESQYANQPEGATIGQQRERTVGDCLDTLDGRLNEMVDRIQALEMKLGTVLTPEPERSQKPAPAVVRGGSPLMIKLDQVADQLEFLAGQIGNITRRTTL